MGWRTLAITAALLFTGFGCVPKPAPTPAPNPAPAPEQQEGEVTLHVGDTKTFEDGFTVTLTEIADSRCKPGVVCIWQGELSPHLRVGEEGQPGEEVILGTETRRVVSYGSHRIELLAATETAATIVVGDDLPDTAVQGECRRTGCSGQLCSDENVASTCEYREEYACYGKVGRCERQADGECGWTESEALTACIEEARGGR